MDAEQNGNELTPLERLRLTAGQNPESFDAQLRYGTALIKAGFVRKAKDALERAVALDAGAAEAWINLGGVRFACWDFAGCVAANQRAIELSPEMVQAHYNLGLGHLYLKQPEQMVAAFRRVLELDGQHGAAHYHLAVGLQALGRTDEAHASLATALQLGHSPQPEFVRELARAHTQQIEQDNKAPVHVLEFGPDVAEEPQAAPPPDKSQDK